MSAKGFKILVTGPFAAGKTSLIRSVSQTPVVGTEAAARGAESGVTSHSTVATDFGTFCVEGSDTGLQLFGAPDQDRFRFMTSMLPGDVDVLAFVIDAEAVETHDAAGVALRALLRDLQVPTVIAVNRCDDPMQAQRLARSLGALDSDAVVACQLNDPDSGRAVVVEMLQTLWRRWSQRSLEVLDEVPRSETRPGSAEPATRPGSAEASAMWDSGRQPASVTLNEARDATFTGEMVFEANPEVVVYLNKGVVYYAELAFDSSLGRRLLDAGLVDAAQLMRGTVSVDGFEYLGRLFDRDPSIDRDAVILMVSKATDELVAGLANRVASSVRATAYPHHPSGVDRWFVAPGDLASMTSEMSPTPLAEPSAVDDDLGFSFDDVDAGELTVDRNDVDSVADAPRFDQLDISMFEVHLDLPPLDEVPLEEAPLDLAPPALVPSTLPPPTLLLSTLPPPTLPPSTLAPPTLPPSTLAPSTLAPPDLVADEFVIEEIDVVEQALPDDEPMTTPQDEVEPELVVPPLALVGDAAPEATGDANDDLAEAVRRAISALESAALDVPAPPGPADPPASANGKGGFASPTLDKRAEVLYDQAVAAPPPARASFSDAAPLDVSAGDAGGGEGGDPDVDRSALRRLLGSVGRPKN